MKIVSLLLCAVILFSFVGCSGTVKLDTLVPTTDAEAPGWSCISTAFDFFAYVRNAAWAYQGEEECVFFFNAFNKNTGLISLNSETYLDDPETLIESRLAEFKSNALENLGPTCEFKEPVYTESNGIKMRFMSFELPMEPLDRYYCYYVMWAAGERIYTCCATAQTDSLDETRAVLSDILNSFRVLSEMEE